VRTKPIVSIEAESPTVKTFMFKDKQCARAKPGQFLMLWIPGVDEVPLSIMDAKEDGRVAVSVKAVGEATRALHQKRTGETVGVRGPFGNSFMMRGHKILVVGGGMGIAPLMFLTRKFVSKAVSTTFVLGAQTRDELLFRSELEKLETRRVRLITSTEDGSCGFTGLCTQPLEQMLTEENFDMIYACGPEQMILKVFELAENQRVNMQASLERLMRCAIGLCGSCIIGKYRVCADGPVFTSRQLREVKHEFGLSKRDRYGKKVPLD
jgi:dihydroorotate dehydrogenase electron transfer subunit